MDSAIPSISFPYEEAPRVLLQDHDGIFGDYFQDRVKSMQIDEVPTAPRFGLAVRLFSKKRRQRSNLIWHNIRLAVDPRQHSVRFRVVGECFLGADELQRAAEAVGDVGEMAERCRDVAFMDVAMHVFVLPGANRLQEIRPVVGAFALGFLGLREGPLFPFAKGFPGVAADFEPALGAVKDVPDFLARAALVVGVATARFQLNDLAVGVGVGGGLGVGRLLRRLVVAVGLDAAVNHGAGSLSLVLREAENPPGRIHGDRVLVLLHAPARDIELVRAGVARVAVAGVPIPVPVVVTAFFVVGRSGAGPSQRS